MGIAYGIGGILRTAPASIEGKGVPNSNFKSQLGQMYFDITTSPWTLYVFNGTTWDSVSVLGAAANFTSLTTSGAVDLASSGDVSVAPGTQSVASPTSSATQNTRVFSVTFTGFTTAGSATQDFTINNTNILATSSIFVTVTNLNASTNGAIMTLDGVTQAAGSVIVHTTNNGAGALGAGDNVIVNGWVIS